MRIAFDIDDTLIVPSVVTGNRDTPNYDTIAIYKWFQAQGNEMILWSGSGMDWASTWGEKLGLQPFTVLPKTIEGAMGEGIDIAFDDCDVDLAKVNVKVKRIKNSISRADWNKNKNRSDICCCGHVRGYHGKSTSINFTDGRCIVCNCENFIIKNN